MPPPLDESIKASGTLAVEARRRIGGVDRELDRRILRRGEIWNWVSFGDVVEHEDRAAIGALADASTLAEQPVGLGVAPLVADERIVARGVRVRLPLLPEALDELLRLLSVRRDR